MSERSGRARLGRRAAARAIDAAMSCVLAIGVTAVVIALILVIEGISALTDPDQFDLVGGAEPQSFGEAFGAPARLLSVGLAVWATARYEPLRLCRGFRRSASGGPVW